MLNDSFVAVGSSVVSFVNDEQPEMFWFESVLARPTVAPGILSLDRGHNHRSASEQACFCRHIRHFNCAFQTRDTLNFIRSLKNEFLAVRKNHCLQWLNAFD